MSLMFTQPTYLVVQSFFFIFCRLKWSAISRADLCTLLYCWSGEGVLTFLLPCKLVLFCFFSVRGAMLHGRANCCGKPLWRLAVSCDYRVIKDMMLGVICKLTGNGRCASYCCFRVLKPNRKRNPIFKRLLYIFISLLSRLGKTWELHFFEAYFFFPWGISIS